MEIGALERYGTASWNDPVAPKCLGRREGRVVSKR